MARAFLFVMDSVGVGGAPDAAEYGDAGADTVGHIAEACAAGRADKGRAGPLRVPHLDRLGLGAACALATGRTPPGLGAEPQGLWGVGVESSNGKDTPSGHWEIAGAPVDFDWGYLPHEVPALPQDVADAICAEAGLDGVLANCHASGTEVIDEHGAEHVSSGRPIFYTSADSVLQIAAHEEAFGLERLYALCEIARKRVDPLRLGRVIARPFTGAAGAFTRTGNRRDYATPPHKPTICDRAFEAGRAVIAIGKIGDIFAHRGISETRKGPGDAGLIAVATETIRTAPEGALVFANFVEFDSEYGHRRDILGYAGALERFDAAIPGFLAGLREGDLLIFTADHGNDPSWTGTDHTRECVPILCAMPGAAPRALGKRRFSDMGASVLDVLGLPKLAHGESVL